MICGEGVSMRLGEFSITEGFKDVSAEFMKTNMPDIVNRYISDFKSLVSKNQITGKERDINFWKTRSFDNFKEFVDKNASLPTGKDIKKSRNVGKSITLAETDDWLVVIPLDKDASCFHGKDTDWCTTKHSNNLFSNYFYHFKWILIYCINKVNMERYAILFRPIENKLELFDKDDNRITAKRFRENTGFDPNTLTRDALARNDLEKGRNEEHPNDLYNIVAKLEKPDSGIESKILKMKNPEMAALYAGNVLERRWPIAEPIIAKDAKEATLYARDVIKGRWPEAEPVIFAHPRWNKVYRAQQGIKD